MRSLYRGTQRGRKQHIDKRLKTVIHSHLSSFFLPLGSMERSKIARILFYPHLYETEVRLAHGDYFLGGGRVNGDDIVKVLLRSSHLDRYRESLHTIIISMQLRGR